MSHKKTLSVLYVCLGNICRSPAAEGILKHLAQKSNLEYVFHVESCGLGDWHEGQLPDERMRRTTKKRGVTLTSRAREIRDVDFEEFDFIFAADKSVVHELNNLSCSNNKIELITKFSHKYPNQDIPDPFYEDQECFEQALDMITDSVEGFLDFISHCKN